MESVEFWRSKAVESRRLALRSHDEMLRDWHLAAERIWLRAAEESAPAERVCSYSG